MEIHPDATLTESSTSTAPKNVLETFVWNEALDALMYRGIPKHVRNFNYEKERLAYEVESYLLSVPIERRVLWVIAAFDKLTKPVDNLYVFLRSVGCRRDLVQYGLKNFTHKMLNPESDTTPTRGRRKAKMPNI